MAACVHLVGTADTGGTPNTSGAFTPAADDLLVVFVQASATTQGTATLTNSAGLTFTQFLRAVYGSGGGASAVYGFVADALAAASSQTVAFDTSSDPSTGTVIAVFGVSGMTKAGVTAVRQSAQQDTQAALGVPAPAFAAVALTGNPTLGMVGNFTNPATLTEPIGWTEGADLGYATPTCGAETVFRDSGFTGTTITWATASASEFCSMIVELDTSAAGGIIPVLMRQSRERRA